MRLLKVFCAIHLKQLSRTLGLPIDGFYCGTRFYMTVFLFLLWVTLMILSSIMVSPTYKCTILNIILQDWIYIIFGTVGIGILAGANWFKFGELNEIRFLLGLPLSRSFISRLKTLLLLAEIALITGAVAPVLIPWGIEIWEVYLGKLIFLVLLIMMGFFFGIFLSSCVAASHMGKAGPYLIAVAFFSLSMGFPASMRLPQLTSQENIIDWILLILLALAALLFALYITSLSVLALYDGADTNVDKPKKMNSSKTGRMWGSFFKAVARKDMIHYWRESNQLLQMLLIFVILVLTLSKVHWFGETGIKLTLFSIPFSFSGIITLHLIGNDGALLSIIKMLDGTLRHYYCIRFALSFAFVAVPVFVVYSILSFLFFKGGYTPGYLAALFLLTLVFTALSLSISVVFRQKAAGSLIQKRGTSIGGEIFYWIFGAGLPLELSLWKPGIDIINDIPVGFHLYAVITVFTTIALLLISFFHIDKLDYR
jgi:hypothetical protein